ncbi:uncharacterized protein GV1 isoform X2 [Periplaneta americana]|uniref:uncharacterized protein GV1 isoform X2 n=1 Tax=Periplaneta americana TaxID=6978 RepID=UPI0037E8EB7A
MKNNYQMYFVTIAAVLLCASANPIMVDFGTRMAPITPPTPAPRLIAPYPPIPPAPVYEDPEPENNSVYAVPVKFGYRLKPLARSYQLPLNYSKYVY